MRIIPAADSKAIGLNGKCEVLFAIRVVVDPARAAVLPISLSFAAPSFQRPSAKRSKAMRSSLLASFNTRPKPSGL